MNTANTAPTPRMSLPDADRIGVAASVLCAIHCGLAPILLLALPAFGEIWAHPASHALVAIFIVPLALFSIRKGFRRHRKSWVAVMAGIGIFSVLVGAVLPAFGKEVPAPAAIQKAPAEGSGVAVCDDQECSDEECAAGGCAASCSAEGQDGEASTVVGCVDNCCPSAQISESGEISIHIPPAAIVTTLGGLFLIAAHFGNIMGCRHCCQPTVSVACQ